MTRNIAEELPARTYAAAPPAGAGMDNAQAPSGGGAGRKNPKSPEARIRQAVYDIRYRARREEMTLQQAFSDYMNHSQMSAKEKALVRLKLFGKGIPMQAEDFNIEDAATSDVANALYRVFVENRIYDGPLVSDYLNMLENVDDRKYKVRVTDRSGRSYVRYATRQKINELRLNPNIESVEMTDIGEPYEGERRRGEQTASALGGGRAKKDYDGDGKIESPAKEHAGAVHNAIQRKRGGIPDGQDTSNVKEAFLGEINAETLNPDANQRPIDVKGKRKKPNKVVMNPELPGSQKMPMGGGRLFAHYEPEGEAIIESGYSKFLNGIRYLQEKAESQQQQKLFGLALSVKRGETPRSEVSEEVLKIVDNMSEEEIRKFAGTSHEGLPKKVDEAKEEEKLSCEDDPRSRYAEMEVIKNRLRARLGMKNPCIMMTAGYEPDGEMVDEARMHRRGHFDTLGRADSRRLGNDPRYGSVPGNEPTQAELDAIMAAYDASTAAHKRIMGGRENLRRRGRVPIKHGEEMFENKNSK